MGDTKITVNGCTRSDYLDSPSARDICRKCTIMDQICQDYQLERKLGKNIKRGINLRTKP